MRALAQLDAQGYVPDRIVLDGNHDYLRIRATRVTTVIKGDATCLAVAAASCVAKVTRDAHDARGGGALPAVRLRVERRLPRARAQGRARGLRPERDPPPVVDLHGALCWRGVPPAPGRLFVVAARTVASRRGGARMDVDLPEVHARSLDATRRIGRRRGRPTSGTSTSVCDDWTVRELVNHIVTGNYWAAELGSAARPSRRWATGSTATCSAPTRCAPTTTRRIVAAAVVPRAGRDGRAVRGVVRAGARLGVLRAPVHRRADPRVGRRQVDRPGHHARPRARRRVLGGGRAAARRCSRGSGAFGTPVDVPDDADRQTRCSQCSDARAERRRCLAPWVSSSP